MPLVLCIDDLQWGDADSGALISELLRPPAPPVLLLVACYRSEDATISPVLRTLLGCDGQSGTIADRRELAVEPLSPSDAEGLARIGLGDENPDAAVLARAIARESGGNPFFISELMRAVRAGTGKVSRLLAPGQVTLDNVLESRIALMPAEARRLLEAIAVCGRPLPRAVALLAARREGDGRVALAALHSGRLIRNTGHADGDEIGIYHDRVRTAVIASLPADALEAYHRELAGAWLACGRAEPEQLAAHYCGANEPERAGPYYLIAAVEATRALAFGRAVELYRLGLNLTRTDGGERRRIQTRLADALSNAGRGAEAAREYLAAADGADDLEALDLRRCAAYQFCISGHLDEGARDPRRGPRAGRAPVSPHPPPCVAVAGDGPDPPPAPGPPRPPARDRCDPPA